MVSNAGANPARHALGTCRFDTFMNWLGEAFSGEAVKGKFWSMQCRDQLAGNDGLSLAGRTCALRRSSSSTHQCMEIEKNGVRTAQCQHTRVDRASAEAVLELKLGGRRIGCMLCSAERSVHIPVFAPPGIAHGFEANLDRRFYSLTVARRPSTRWSPGTQAGRCPPQSVDLLPFCTAAIRSETTPVVGGLRLFAAGARQDC